MKHALMEVERIEAEAGCELEELPDPALRERAQRLLACEDPPRGDDLALCQAIAYGRDYRPALARLDGLYTQEPTMIYEDASGGIGTCEQSDALAGGCYAVGIWQPGADAPRMF